MTTARIPFSAADESAIRTLTATMLFLMVVNFVMGGLGLVGGCLSFFAIPGQLAIHPAAGVGALLTGACTFFYCAGMVAQGALLLQTRSALELVVTSDTQDQAQLAEAFAKLRLFFALEAVMFLLSMGLQCGGFLTQAFAPMSQLHQLGGVS